MNAKEVARSLEFPARTETETTRVVRCKICGRWLNNPVSVERGVGPVCWDKLQNGEITMEDDECG